MTFLWGPFFVLGPFALAWFSLSFVALATSGWLFGRAVAVAITQRF
jgi:hypothetical protein